MPARAVTLAQARAGLADPDPSARPMMRWWWFGPEVEHAEIDRELRAMAAAGIGGAEVAFVYPLRETTTPFLSPAHREALAHAARTARELGLRFDVTLGSGWSYGGGHIGPEHAARRLHWERRDIGLESLAVPLDGGWPGDELVAAYLGEGADAADWQLLPRTGGTLTIPPGRGPRRVLLAWSRPTGQQVKRAAAGAEGPVLDHFSAAATRRHLDVVGTALLDAVPAELIGSVFSDSLEVYGADWTPRLPEEFRRRRGYDLLPVLPLVLDGARITGEGADVDPARLRIDLGRTRSELVEDGFVATCQEWAREHGVRFRLQGYGEPPIELSTNRLVDLIEGEGVGWKGLPQTRWATSAAHLDGRDDVSTEIWTWVHSPSFRATPLDLKGEAHEHLLLGSTHFVGHGWPYSPPDAPGLGWVFYAAGALDDRNPWWPAMPELTRYLTGLCWLLRQGRGVADVKIYVPADDVRVENPGPLDLWRAVAARIGPDIPAAIRENGYDLDLVDDRALETLDPAEVPILVLPGTRRLPADTAHRIAAIRAAGGAVLAVAASGTTPPAGPAEGPQPMAELATAHVPEGGLAAALHAALAPDLALDGDGGEIGVVHRRLEDGDVYFVANTGPRTRTLSLRPRDEHAAYEAWDPATGHRRPVDLSAVELHPYAAIVLAGADAVENAAARAETLAPARPDTGDTAPVAHRRERVGLRLTEVAEHVHEAALEIDPAWLRPGAGVVLDLGPCTPAPAPADAHGYRAEVHGPVREIAVVRLDGVQVGVLWDAPFRLDLTEHLRAGTSTLRLEVHGTAAAALAADPHLDETVAGARRASGDRFTLQDLDRALDEHAVGLRESPVLEVRLPV
ncbi:hypothetical protein BF93_10630 [Brachybacterium phenoliresistens]|uniref:Glycoside hydrolase n=1 Tax=Brachybacterium phenoliresistens TaxID=396014 RepID=Z9JWQ9_9MICO|nr:glycosyl hydrolase [Brachybacterium phenoliresistens]EWS82438.1 hypothetical protein BF93_10630 [Brachybacterium phenoliresistens]